jgi:hypothetical protein
MLSTYANKQNTHLVIDTTTNGILIAVHSNVVANAICFKILNTEAMSIRLVDFNEEINPLLKPQFNESSNFILTKVGHNLTPQSTANVGQLVKSTDGNGRFGVAKMSEVTDEWIALRKKAHNIKEVIASSDLRVLRSATPSKKFFGDTITFPFIKKELDKCNPQEDQYTDAIREWANIVNVPVKKGFEMLSAESNNITHLVNNSRIFWSKKCL